MNREQYNSIKALNASTIKAAYKDRWIPPIALEIGATFHYELLECDTEQMSMSTLYCHSAIMASPILSTLFNESAKEVLIEGVVELGGYAVEGKGIADMLHPSGIVCDFKLTQSKNIALFGEEMEQHGNHIQAVWYCKMLGIDYSRFYFIGVPPQARRAGAKPHMLYLYKCTDEQLQRGEQLIINYFNIMGK